MQIKGIQKVSLIDYPGRVASTFFLYGCNFRCGFCHNPSLVLTPDMTEISEESALKYLEENKRYLDGVCLTGGEPLLTLDIDFLKKIKDMGFEIKIDTNGSFPEKLKEFIDAGLVDYIAMDIKGSKNIYPALIGLKPDMDKIEQSIKLITNFKEYEFRTTIVSEYHDVPEVMKIRDWLLEVSGKQKLKAFYLQGFVPRPKEMLSASFDNIPATTEQVLLDMKEKVKDSFDVCEIRK